MAAPKEFESPPEYSEQPLSQVLFIDPASINSNTSRRPNVENCITHLKLLQAFYNLHASVTTSDQLFGICDSFAHPAPGAQREDDLKKIRDKRWEIYAARAAHRFEKWWSKIIPCSVGGKPMGRLEVRQIARKERFEDLPRKARALVFTKDTMPPLDVLMIWQVFMLSPRNFLEDCIRFGKMDFWATGIPWDVLEACFEDAIYTPGDAAKMLFEERTGHEWDNLIDAPVIKLTCPKDDKLLRCPWTTCDQETRVRDIEDRLLGRGYADREFRMTCQWCGTTVTHESLRLQRLKNDAQDLVLNNYAMPGTILSAREGTPTSPNPGSIGRHPTTFPNRLIATGLIKEIVSIADGRRDGTMKDIMDCIENAIVGKRAVRKANQRRFSAKVGAEERAAIRRMLLRYWDNNSPFTFNLAEAAIKQVPFLETTQELDWLQSPELNATVSHALKKYDRYFQILRKMKGNPPTVDVDLVWHTDQLSPQGYYEYSVKMTGRLVVHSHDFEDYQVYDFLGRTAEEYLRMFGEPYTDSDGSDMAIAMEKRQEDM